MQESLSRFLDQEAATLDSCASEPIHLSGRIQAVGVLIVLDGSTRTSVAASENAGELLGPGFAPGATVPGELFDATIDALTGIDHGDVSVTLPDPWTSPDGSSWDVLAAATVGGIFLEFLPSAALPLGEIRGRFRFTQRTTAMVQRAESFDDALRVAADGVRSILGFGRVMIYQFQADWSGRVVAESREPRMSSYLGLYFPESDIPRQARHLYSLVPTRCVAEVHDDTARIAAVEGVEELDLTYSTLRSVSPMHTAYLRNMGVESTFSARLMLDGELWGLIACHHDEPGLVPLDLWGLVREVGAALMVRCQQQEVFDRGRMIERVRQLELEIARDVRISRDVEGTVRRFVGELRRAVDADGLAVSFGDGPMLTDGVVPPDDFIARLLREFPDGSDSAYYADSAFVESFPDAEPYLESCAGVLIHPIKLHRTFKLIWFRGPVTESATWAGNPHEKALAPRGDGTEVLQPRHSFDRWVADHLRISRPWRRGEIEAAQSIFGEILDLIASQRRLEESNRDLEAFTRATAHDLREPLRTIGFALQLLSDEEEADLAGPELVAEMREAASVSQDRMRALIDQMMTFVGIGKGSGRPRPVALNGVLEDVSSMLAEALHASDATLEIEPLPTVVGDPSLLTTVFLNLVSNALKFAEPGSLPRIRIHAAHRLGRQIVHVDDWGRGIPETHREAVFEPFMRMQTQEEAKGSGLGLSIVRRAMELHGGWATANRPEVGASTRITLQFADVVDGGVDSSSPEPESGDR